MKVSWNVKPCDVPEDLATFGDLIDYMEQHRIPEEQVITRIMVNGEELDDEQELEFRDRSLAELELVEFYSSRTIDLAQEGLSDATQLIPSLVEDLPGVATELRAGNVREGLEMFSRCVEVVSWYVSLIAAIDIIFRRNDPSFRLDPTGGKGVDGLMDTDFTGLTVDEGPELNTFASIENLRQKLMDIERAQENNDTLLLADLIEYEVLPITRIWADEVPMILAKVSREGGAA